MAEAVQVFVAWSQASLVQTSPSLQSLSTLQQPVTAPWLHWLVSVLHLSVVQGSLSSQSATVMQHAATGVFTHCLDALSQRSVVHGLLSLQSGFVAQEPTLTWNLVTPVMSPVVLVSAFPARPAPYRV